MWKTNFPFTHRLTQVFIGQAIFTVEIFLLLRRELCRENVNREDSALFQMAFLCGKVHFMGTQVGVCSVIVSHRIECDVWLNRVINPYQFFLVWRFIWTAPILLKHFACEIDVKWWGWKWDWRVIDNLNLLTHQTFHIRPPNLSYRPSINNWTTPWTPRSISLRTFHAKLKIVSSPS